MNDVFLGEIRYVAFNFAPQGWALCQGQLLPIAQYTALFSLLGTTYGGNGTTTFALPDLQSRVLIGQGQGDGLTPRDLGEEGGVESVQLTANEIPAHSHTIGATNALATSTTPVQGVIAKPNVARNGFVATSGAKNAVASPAAIASSGGSLAHENRAPGLVLNGIIALQGIYPPRP